MPEETTSEDPSVIVWPSVAVIVTGSESVLVSVRVPVSVELVVRALDDAATADSVTDTASVGDQDTRVSLSG